MYDRVATLRYNIDQVIQYHRLAGGSDDEALAALDRVRARIVNIKQKAEDDG